MEIKLKKNIDILKTISTGNNRPKIVVGFAAETENLVENAQKKLVAKNCDFIVANNIKDNDVFGSDKNKVMIIDRDQQVKEFDELTKTEVADEIVKILI